MPARTLPFYKLSPGGNPTILVHDNTLFAETEDMFQNRASVAREMMDLDHIGAEQVGFLDTSRSLPHMEMMGGEFCLNAIRSAALIFALLDLLPPAVHKSTHCEGTITTSGIKETVRVRVAAPPADSGLSPDMARDVAVAFPLSTTIPDAPKLFRDCGPGETLVRLPGITHLLLDTTVHPQPKNPLAAAAIKRAEYNLDKDEAAGVIWHTPRPQASNFHCILPVVRVQRTGSVVAETACGSGSLALALLLAKDGGNVFTIRQPSGHNITVCFEPLSHSENQILAWVSGTVLLRAQGIAYIGVQ